MTRLNFKISILLVIYTAFTLLVLAFVTFIDDDPNFIHRMTAIFGVTLNSYYTVNLKVLLKFALLFAAFITLYGVEETKFMLDPDFEGYFIEISDGINKKTFVYIGIMFLIMVFVITTTSSYISGSNISLDGIILFGRHFGNDVLTSMMFLFYLFTAMMILVILWLIDSKLFSSYTNKGVE